MLPVLSVAGLTIPMGPLFWVLAFTVGSEVGGRAIARLGAKRVPSQQDQWQGLYNQAVVVALLIGLVVARVSYALRDYPLYVATPSLLLSLRPETLAVAPGIMAALAVLMAWLIRRGVGLAAATDATAVGVAAAIVIVKLGQFLTGTAYGLPTDVPWGVMLWGTLRHPVQLYEALSWFGLWLFLWWNLRRYQPGETFWRLLAGGSASTLILEAFHATSPTLWVGVRVPQVVALGLLLVGLYVLSFYARSPQPGAGHEDYPKEGGQPTSELDAAPRHL